MILLTPYKRVSPFLAPPVILGLLLLMVAFGHVALRGYVTAVFPYQIDPEEGFLLDQAMRLSQGATIYEPTDRPPYVAGTYAPVYPYLIARGPALVVAMALGLIGAVAVFQTLGGGLALALCNGLALVVGLEWGHYARHVWEVSPGDGSLAAVGPWALAGVMALVTALLGWQGFGLWRGVLAGLTLPILWTLHWQWISPALADLAPSSMLEARLPALMAQLVCGALVAWNVFYLGRRNLLAALFAGGLFYLSGEVYNWTGFARVDFPALMFSLLGLSAVTLSVRHPQGLVAAVVLFAALAVTKQSQIMAPLAAILFLLTRRLALGLVFALSLALAVAVVAGALHLVTDGQYLVHTVAYNANVFYWHQLRPWVAHLWMFHLFAWLALAGFALRQVWLWVYLRQRGAAALYEIPDEEYAAVEAYVEPIGRRERLPYEFDWTVWYLVVCLLSLVGFAKAGVSYNYMIEPWAAICLYLGVRVGRELTPGVWAWILPCWQVRVGQAMGMVALALLLWQVVYALGPWGPAQEEWTRDRPRPPLFTITAINPGEQDLAMGREVEQALASTLARGGEVLTELPIFEIRAGRPALWQPFIMAQLAREDKWDDRPVVEWFEQQRFDLVVTTRRLETDDRYVNYTDAMLAALRGAYRCSAQIAGSPIFNYYLYTPDR